MDKIKNLVQAKNFIWLLKYAKQFTRLILGAIAINILSAVAGVSSVVISKQMVDSAVYGIGTNLVILIVIFIAIQLVIMSLGAISSKLSVKLSEKMSYQIQNDILKRIYNSDWKSLNSYHSGDVLTRLTDDIDTIVYLWVSTIPGILALGIQLILAFSILLYFDSALALLAFFLGPISIVISFLLGLRVKDLQHRVQKAESQYRSFLTELIQHILIIKSFQFEKKSMDKVVNLQDEKYDSAVKRNNMGITANLVMSGGYWLSYGVAFVYGVYKLSVKSTTFGTFTAFLQLVSQIQGPFIGFARNLPHLLSSFASVERLIELEEFQGEKVSPFSGVKPSGKYGVLLKNISFGYDSKKKVFSNSTFKVDKGNIVAIIGSSGEGKTTVMRLLLGLIKAQSGDAFIVGENSNRINVSESTRSYFTYVPQGNTLFSGSIRENLLVGKVDATNDELESALTKVCAWDFIQELPEKMESYIGESGVGLSEGQAQRICIARALLREAPILLLDEATSALDMETEKNIFENIKRMDDKTCIVITHRLSVLPLCDAVYRLENARFYKHKTRDFATILLNEKNA